MLWQEELLKDKVKFSEKVNSICIVGAAKSGIAAAKLALELGKKVYLTDSEEIDIGTGAFPLLKDLIDAGVEIQSGGHTKEFITQADCVVISPGVPTGEFKGKYIDDDMPFVGEIEFASWYLKTDDIIAITGTNGKTTTTTVSAEILRLYTQKPVYCLGNIGSPLSEFVLDIEKDAIVCLELSSFQLETAVSFKAHIAVLLNLSPDHLDRYDSPDEYYKAKTKIFDNLTVYDHIVTSFDLKDYCHDNAAIQHLLNEPSNISFVKVIASQYDVSEQSVYDFWDTFNGLEHRREYVASIDGVRYVNDSKATNVEATIWALKSETGNIILLVGGKDKGFDFLGITSYLSNVKKIIAFGATAEKIKIQLSDFATIEVVEDLNIAVKRASEIAQAGDTVLLSPMCSSFDQFENYMQRGHVFREQVYKLRG